MAGSASKRPHSPDKMTSPTDPSPPDGKPFGSDLDDRATASGNTSEKKKRTKAHHERHQSNPEEGSSAASTRNQAAIGSRRIDSGLGAKSMFGNQTRSSPERQNTSASLRSSSESKPSSISSGMKTGSSSLTTPEDPGIQTQNDVSELRAWWANLKSKTTGCGSCGSLGVFENITTDYIREQIDAEYAISVSVQAAEKLQRQRKAKESEIREETFARSRWGRGKKLGEKKPGEEKIDKEREKIPSPKGKGKEVPIVETRKLGKLLGVATCPTCDNCICLGCLRPLEDSQVGEIEVSNSTLDAGALTSPKPQKTKGSHLRKNWLWCCDEGRVAGIILTLACIDEDTLGLSGDDNLNSNSPSRKGFGGAVKRGIRSLKDKIAEGALPRSPSFKSKSKSKTVKGNGTGYGSGGYGNANSLFGLEMPEPEDWEEVDTSDSDDLDNDSHPFQTSYPGIMPAIAPANYTPPVLPGFNPQKLTSSFPSVHFSGPGQKLGDGNTIPATENGPLQTAEPPVTDYIDLTMDDPPPPKPIGTLGSLGRGTHLAGISYLPPWDFSGLPRGRGAARGRGGAHHIIHFSGPGQTLGGLPATIPKADPLPANPKPLSSADNLPYFLPPDWAQNFPQHPGTILPQEAPDGLLTNVPANPGPEKLLDPRGAELLSILGPAAPPDYSLFPPIPSPSIQPPLSSYKPWSGTGSSAIKAHLNAKSKAAQSIPPPPPLSPEQTKHDKTLAAIMSLLTELLPKSSWDSLFDLTPPPPLKTMLRTSMLVEKAEELLRNDSVQDISIHSQMYIALMGLLRQICACPETDFLVMERRRKKLHTIGLLKIMQSLPLRDDISGSGPKTRGKIAAAAEEKKRAEVLTYEESSDRKTLIEVSANLCTQAKFFLKGAGKSEGSEFDGAEAVKILGICLEIVSIREEFDRLASRTSDPTMISSLEDTPQNRNKHLASPTSIRKKKVPLQLGFEYHSPIAFEYTENVLDGHHYKAQANDLKQSPRGRVLHLTRELATMSTSLPQGIFVRVEDSRPDVLKALIVGPGGTPYEGGLYEFDIWAPMEYPVMPPNCIFKTTGGGSVHFNPNLYNCGKVCLSILNTWEGAASEKWQPAVSTLLQVFVSIQSMILCDNPWYNEPGRREGTQKKQSEDFNTRVRLNNIRFAMLDWIKDPEKRNGVWKDVIKAHFTENRSYVIDLIKGWGKKDPSIHNWRQGMGTLYGGAVFWPDDYLAGAIAGGRRLVGEAIPAIPACMDMVAEMEALTKKFFEDGEEN